MNNLLLASLLTLTFQFSFGQNGQYSDCTKLSSTPEYKAAQIELDNLSNKWQKEIEIKYSEIEGLYKTLDVETSSLTIEQKNKLKTNLAAKEKEVIDLRNYFFGENGELFKKRNELIKLLLS